FVILRTIVVCPLKSVLSRNYADALLRHLKMYALLFCNITVNARIKVAFGIFLFANFEHYPQRADKGEGCRQSQTQKATLPLTRG
ncbi:MAG: hypothetical protein PUC05_03500, partial [Firmicutes bacterium]|nr:hypothetical protein [Bacillota bacterium]